MTAAEVVAARKRLGWSLTRLGNALGVDRMTVWRWEHGDREPPDYLRLALAQIEVTVLHTTTERTP